MKIYIVRVDDVADYATLHHDLEAFYKKEDAKKRYDEILNDAKSEDWLDGWEVEETEDSFSAWPDGEWGTDHYEITIEEVDVK